MCLERVAVASVMYDVVMLLWIGGLSVTCFRRVEGMIFGLEKRGGGSDRFLRNLYGVWRTEN